MPSGKHSKKRGLILAVLGLVGGIVIGLSILALKKRIAHELVGLIVDEFSESFILWTSVAAFARRWWV